MTMNLTVGLRISRFGGFIAVTYAIFLYTLMLVIVLHTLITHGPPSPKQLFTPWMIASLTDFYISIVIFCAWVAHKEANLISTILWIISLVCFGSTATFAYIVVQLFKLTSSQESSQDHMYYLLLRSGTELKLKHSFVVSLRILFSILGAIMLGTLVYTLVIDGSPSCAELSNPWMAATLLGFYFNVVALAVWINYKESLIYAVFWTILLICFGSITACIYVVWQLFQISSYDPAYFILVKHSHRAGLTDV